MTNTNTAVAKADTVSVAKPKTVKGWLQRADFQEELAKCLPKHLTPERYARVCITALTRTPGLKKCTPESVMKCMLDLSATGLEPDGRHAHLIPYKDECTLIIDYKGLVAMAMRSGAISNIHADVVCVNDEFEENLGQITKHIIDRRKPRGEVYAAYCMVRYKDQSVPPKCEVMSKEEIEIIRKRSKASTKGPWVTDWNEMAKKTVFRRAAKWLPLSSEIHEYMSKDDEYIDISPSSPVARAKPPNLFTQEVEQEEPESEPADDTPVESEVHMLREQIKRDKLKESELIDLCIKEGILSDTMTSLDDVQKIEPHCISKILDQWSELKGELLNEDDS